MEMQEWLSWIVPIGTVFAALISARASRISASAARRSSKVAQDVLEANRKIAENDWRIRLLEERMKVWRAFDDLMIDYTRRGVSTAESIALASAEFQRVPFLFPDEIDNYLKKIQKRLFRQMILEARRGQIREGVHWQEVFKEQEKEKNLCTWLGNQQKQGKAIFQKHMSLID
ncbi:hypothetical protein [Enterobacter mori]|uniref:hypothetical protein n=1 Tax=Enterobacter mori TaxID=539813 RepID=UPI001B8AF147|nr:hypothetical protein [Enterobacter mori]MBS3046010.1 hypothetical protein [Enterobacter mori]